MVGRVDSDAAPETRGEAPSWKEIPTRTVFPRTVGTTDGNRTNRTARRLGAAWAAALALLLATAGAAGAIGGAQVVGGVVEDQFGAAVAADGTITGSSSTIKVKVTRTVENGVEVITISPR